MKSILFTFILLLSVGHVALAQAPEAIKYQAAIRDADGNRLTSSAVGVQISILQDSATGNVVYTETFAETTTTSGLLNIEIGGGTSTTGSFTDIEWSQGPYFVELSLDIAGGSNYTTMGTTQLVSVPYSLYANTTNGSQVLSKADRAAIGETTVGTIIYCSDCGANGEMQIYNGSEWTNMVGGPIVE